MRNSSDEPGVSLAVVQQQFEHWRCRRSKKREPIPAHLWQAAVMLCTRYPITHVCRQLRLSFAELKKRVSSIPEPAPGFVQIDMSDFSGPWQLECERADGARLRLSGSGRWAAIEALLSRFVP